MSGKTKKILLFFSFAFLLGSFFNSYISTKVWDYDFWWHLATGRYIVETRSLPETDPFTDVNNLQENQQIKNPLGMQFNLKQYWLAQVFFYKIYKSFGDAGIMTLRAGLLFLNLLIIFAFMIRRNVSYFIIFPLLFIAHLNNYYFLGERPVLFTLVFSVLTFSLLEEYRRSGNKLIFFLLPLMTLWANLHGGFILGIILISAYIVGETATYLLKKDPGGKRKLLILYFVGISAIALSALNPNGLKGFLALTPQYVSMFQGGIQEYFSPFVLYQKKVSPVNWSYVAMLVVLPIVLVIRNRRMEITHLLLLGGLAYMSMTALRYVVFYVSIGAMILGPELDVALKEYSEKFRSVRLKLEPVLIVFMLLSSVLHAAGYLNPGKVVFGKAVRHSVPEGAADFIENNHIKGPMFNDMSYGGYLMWRFYPGRKIFYDTRALNFMVMRESDWIMQALESVQSPVLPEGKTPLWERLLDHYKIDFMLLNTRDAFGTIPQVIFGLIRSDEWVPVFYDGISVLFVRDNDNNQEIIEKYRIDEESIYNMLIATFSSMAMDDTGNPHYLVSLGDIFYNMQSYADALKAYEYADKRLPGQFGIAEKIKAAKKYLPDEKAVSKKDNA